MKLYVYSNYILLILDIFVLQYKMKEIYLLLIVIIFKLYRWIDRHDTHE